MRALLLLLALVPLALCELHIHDLTPGQLHRAVKPIYDGPNEDAALDLDYYRIWVPENAIAVEFDFTAENYYCDMYAYYRTLGLPCPYYDPYWDAPCYDDAQYISSDSTRTVYKSYHSDLRFVTEGYWFIGIGRYSSYYADEVCPYNITISFITCPENQTDWYGDGQIDNCIPKIQEDKVTVPGEWEIHDQIYQSFDVIIPDENVGLFSVMVNTTDYYVDIYGYSWGPASYYGSQDGKYEWTDEDIGGITYYQHWYHTFAPRAGRYNVLILQTNDEPFNGTVKTYYNKCSGTNVGPNCTGVLHASNDVGPFVKTETGYDYWKFQVWENTTVQVTFNVSDASGYGYVFVKPAAAPFYDSNGGYDNSAYYDYISSSGTYTFTLYPMDSVVTSDWWAGFYTYTAPITFAVNAAVDTTPTTGGTTATTAATATTATTATTASTGTTGTTGTTGSTGTDGASGSTGTAATTGAGSTGSTGSTTNTNGAATVAPTLMLIFAALMFFL